MNSNEEKTQCVDKWLPPYLLRDRTWLICLLLLLGDAYEINRRKAETKAD